MPKRSFEICWADSGTPQSSEISVLEEDSYGVLSAPAPVALPFTEHPVRLYTDLYEFSPFPLGSIQIRGKHIWAIVIDTEQNPPCDPVWIVQAWEQVFAYLKKTRPHSVSLPLLGCRHGKLPAITCLRILFGILQKYPATPVHKVILEMDSTQRLTAQKLFGNTLTPRNRIYFFNPVRKHDRKS